MVRSTALVKHNKLRLRPGPLDLPARLRFAPPGAGGFRTAAQVVPERILDVPDRQAAGEQFDREPFQRLGPAFQALADLRAERLLAAGDLRGGVVDQPLGLLQPPRPNAVAIAPAGLGAALVISRPSASRHSASSASSTISRVASFTSSARPSGEASRPSISSDSAWRVRIERVLSSPWGAPCCRRRQPAWWSLAPQQGEPQSSKVLIGVGLRL